MHFPCGTRSRTACFVELVAMSILLIFSYTAHAADLYLLSGAGLRQPVDELTKNFTKDTSIKVRIDYSGTGKALARYKATRQGDVFLPGSHLYVEKLQKDGEILSSYPVVLHTPVLAVWRKTTKKIEKLADLAAPGVRVGLGDPKAMALGRTADEILEKSDLTAKILPNVKVRAATVKQLALYVTRGDVDAGIIGRTDTFQFKDKIRRIDIDKSLYTPDVITVAILKTARKPEDARKLAKYLSSPTAVKVFGKYGFLPLNSQ